jgi:hypothetical protein
VVVKGALAISRKRTFNGPTMEAPQRQKFFRIDGENLGAGSLSIAEKCCKQYDFSLAAAENCWDPTSSIKTQSTVART